MRVTKKRVYEHCHFVCACQSVSVMTWIRLVSEVAWLHLEEPKFEAEWFFCFLHIDITTMGSLKREIFAHFLPTCTPPPSPHILTVIFFWLQPSGYVSGESARGAIWIRRNLIRHRQDDCGQVQGSMRESMWHFWPPASRDGPHHCWTAGEVWRPCLLIVSRSWSKTEVMASGSWRGMAALLIDCV